MSDLSMEISSLRKQPPRERNLADAAIPSTDPESPSPIDDAVYQATLSQSAPEEWQGFLSRDTIRLQVEAKARAKLDSATKMDREAAKDWGMTGALQAAFEEIIRENELEFYYDFYVDFMRAQSIPELKWISKEQFRRLLNFPEGGAGNTSRQSPVSPFGNIKRIVEENMVIGGTVVGINDLRTRTPNTIRGITPYGELMLEGNTVPRSPYGYRIAETEEI